VARGSNNRAAPAWLRPPGDQIGLRSFGEALREQRWIAIAILIATLAAAAAYLLTADSVYEGEAELLVTPVPAEDPLVASLGLLRPSSDPTRDVQTVSTLTTNLSVAQRVREELGLDRSALDLLDDVTAEPVASSNIVAITAQAESPQFAAELANAFASEVVAERTEALHDRVDEILPELQARLEAGGSALSPDQSIETEIARLEVLRAAPDPTIRVATEAVPDNTAVAPRPLLTIVGALVAGLVLGIAGAFVAQALDPRLRREQQLRNRYQLPILARIPKEHGRRGRPLGPAAISPPGKEAYRTLRANITAARTRSGAQTILVTGSAPAEGKTTTAVNLAASLALAGERVVLIEADLRRPAIGNALGITVETGVVATLLENVSLDDALVTTAPFGPSLELLLADYAGGWMSELFSLSAADQLLDAARARADYVIIDSPPLTTVVDALPLARRADQVILVSRLGTTRLDRLQELAELMATNDITPLGFALVGTGRTDSSYYFGEGSERVRPRKRRRGRSSPEPEPEPVNAGD
jgi:polysaccharide biosynthesis transport protein